MASLNLLTFSIPRVVEIRTFFDILITRVDENHVFYTRKRIGYGSSTIDYFDQHINVIHDQNVGGCIFAYI